MDPRVVVVGSGVDPLAVAVVVDVMMALGAEPVARQLLLDNLVGGPADGARVSRADVEVVVELRQPRVDGAVADLAAPALPADFLHDGRLLYDTWGSGGGGSG